MPHGILWKHKYCTLLKKEPLKGAIDALTKYQTVEILSKTEFTYDVNFYKAMRGVCSNFFFFSAGLFHVCGQTKFVCSYPADKVPYIVRFRDWWLARSVTFKLDISQMGIGIIFEALRRFNSNPKTCLYEPKWHFLWTNVPKVTVAFPNTVKQNLRSHGVNSYKHLNDNFNSPKGAYPLYPKLQLIGCKFSDSVSTSSQQTE